MNTIATNAYIRQAILIGKTQTISHDKKRSYTVQNMYGMLSSADLPNPVQVRCSGHALLPALAGLVTAHCSPILLPYRSVNFSELRVNFIYITL